MSLSNYLSVPQSTHRQGSFKHTPQGKENVYFCPQLNSPISSRHYEVSSNRSEAISSHSSRQNEDSRVILGDITASFVEEEDSHLSSSIISMFYDERSQTQTTTSRDAKLSNSNITKKNDKKDRKNYLEQQLQSYSSVPTNQSKVLRY